MPDIHPTKIELEPAMWLTVLIFAVPVVMLTAGLIVARYRLYRREAQRLGEDVWDDETEMSAADAAPSAALKLRGAL